MILSSFFLFRKYLISPRNPIAIVLFMNLEYNIIQVIFEIQGEYKLE